MTRRKLLVTAGGVTAGLVGLGRLDQLARKPVRIRQEDLSASGLPDIQFDIGSFLAAPVTLNDGADTVTAQFPPVFTWLATVRLGGRPNSNDQHALADALDFLGGSNRLAGNSVASPRFSVSFNCASTRIEFMQVGMPRSVADNASLPYAGGPAYFNNVFQGTGDAARNAKGIKTFQGERRMGHLCALQRSSRASDGTPRRWTW